MTVTSTGHHFPTRLFGLSTDTKPDNAMVDATFLETDTQEGYVYSGTAWVRDRTVVVEAIGVVAVKEERDILSVLEAILTEMKIQNAHLALVTGEHIAGDDLED